MQAIALRWSVAAALFLVCAGAVHAQSTLNYFSESAYRHHGNAVPPSSTVEGVCASVAVPWGWTSNGYSYTVEQELPGRWRCQRYYNGVREPSWYIWVLGQCQVNAAPPRSGAYWSHPYWDESVGDCYCTAPAKFDASIQWCDSTPAYLPATPLVCRDESCTVGNPVQPGSGTKLHSEADYTGAGAHPLTLTRLYRSDSVAASSLANVEVGWMHSYGSRLVLNPYGNGNPVVAIRPDASLRRFTTASVGVPRTWQGDSVTRDVLTEVRDAAGALTGWRYAVVADDSLETYDATGRLLSIQARNGWMTTLTYSDANTPFDVAPRAGLLISVENHFGRELRFVYNTQARIAEVLPPGAITGSAPGNATSPIRYTYEEAASLSGVPPQGQLTSVTWQDGTTRRYHYEDNRHPRALTGITDEAGTRYATYAYDSNRRVVSQQHAGGTDRVDFSYASNQTVVTNYSPGTATQHTYSFTNQDGVLRPTAVSAPCPQCGNTAQSSSYDSAGNLAKSVGHDGKPTFYKYDAKHREIERATYAAGYASATTRPALNLAEGVISTKWHGTWNLPTQVAEPGKISVYTYNARGMTGESWTATTDATGAAKFNAVKTGSTYATGWGYNANGLNTSIVEKVDTVIVSQATLAYDALGNATRLTNTVTGEIARGTYDVHGRLINETDPFGATTSSYTPRGFALEQRNEEVVTTATHNALGFVTEVRTTPGKTIQWTYTTAHKVYSVTIDGVPLIGTLSPRKWKPGFEFISTAHAQTTTLPSTTTGGGLGRPVKGPWWVVLPQVGYRIWQASQGDTTDKAGENKKDCDPCDQPAESLGWDPNRWKHTPKKGLTWPQTVVSTGTGEKLAKYHPAHVPNRVAQEAFERAAWNRGTPSRTNKRYKYMKFPYVIGASDGAETVYVRIECTDPGVIHGHPVPESEYRRHIGSI